MKKLNNKEFDNFEFDFNDLIIFEGDYFILSHDWDYPIPGLFNIYFKEDNKDFNSFSNEEKSEFDLLLSKVKNISKNNNLGINELIVYKDEFAPYDNDYANYKFFVLIFPKYDWMNKYGKSLKSTKSILEYSKSNMYTKKNISNIIRIVNLFRKSFGNKIEVKLSPYLKKTTSIADICKMIIDILFAIVCFFIFLLFYGQFSCLDEKSITKKIIIILFFVFFLLFLFIMLNSF